ncbi:MAG: hypothetical protein K6C12_14925 [Oscillospiraceae bacterium]|nr:hypothetical protein [Oscillospiraceae bacterium]
MIKREDDEEYIDLGQVIRVLWKHVVLILLVGILFAALLFSYARFFVTPKYEANALFYVNNSSISLSSAVRISTGELSAASDLVETYLAILQSRSNMEQVLEQSKVDYTYQELRKMIDAKAVNSTGLFEVIVTSENPEEARAIANTIAAILPDKISDIVANSSVELVDYAVTPHERVSPSYIKYAAVGLLLGMVLCSGIVVLIDFMDDIIHDEDYLLQNYQYPVLATIPDLTAKSPKKYGYGYYGSNGKSKTKGGVA